jgi:hypothetical protein
MPAMTVHDLIPILQVAIGPMILVSGVGLLLLSMTNRLGRTVDRARELSRHLQSAAPGDRARLRSQLDILLQRARLLRSAIALASISVLLAAVLVIVLFVTALFGLGTVPVLIGLFSACMAALVVSLVLFLKDVNLSLAALKLEIEASESAGRGSAASE